jgi:hypothetical protein
MTPYLVIHLLCATIAYCIIRFYHRTIDKLLWTNADRCLYVLFSGIFGPIALVVIVVNVLLSAIEDNQLLTKVIQDWLMEDASW